MDACNSHNRMYVIGPKWGNDRIMRQMHFYSIAKNKKQL